MVTLYTLFYILFILLYQNVIILNLDILPINYLYIFSKMDSDINSKSISFKEFFILNFLKVKINILNLTYNKILI